MTGTCEAPTVCQLFREDRYTVLLEPGGKGEIITYIFYIFTFRQRLGHERETNISLVAQGNKSLS